MTALDGSAAPSSRTRIALLAGLALVTLAVYSRALFCDFVYYDDGLYVFDNRYVRDGMTLAGLRGILVTGETGTWQPVALLSHMIDCQLFGLAPWGHHLTAVVLHAANAVLLTIALTRLTGRYYPSLVVAAIFALHPAHVESVAWVSERKDVLSTLFWILCLIAYERYARGGGARRYLAPLVLLALGLMTKPMLVTLPCVLLLLDYWPLRRMDKGHARLLLEKLPMFALVAASSVITVIVQRQNRSIVSLENLPLSARLGNVAVSYVKYIALTVWPSGLAIDYPHPKMSLSILSIAASCAVLVAMSIAAFLARDRAPYAPVGWSWYLGALVPVVGFVHVGEQGMADRYTYIPTIGLAIAVVWSADALIHRGSAGRRIQALSSACLAIALPTWAALTWIQIGYWKDTEALWARAVAVNPKNERAQRNLGAVYVERREYAKAIPHFQAAASVNPDDPRTLHNLGAALMRTGDLNAALDALTRAANVDATNADTRNNIGICLIRLNRDAGAAAVLREAARLGSADPILAADIATNLGVALWKSGQPDEAIETLQSAIERFPGQAKLHNVLGVVLNSIGHRADAIAEFQQALRIDPAFDDARRNLGALGG